MLAIVALALGIGANTTIFSFVHAMLLHPLRYRQPRELVTIQEQDKRGRPTPVSLTFYHDCTRLDQVFSDVAAYDYGWFSLTGVAEPEEIPGALVSTNFLGLLGVQPLLGRDFRPEEQQSGRDRVVILSHGAWMRRFGGDPRILGKTIALDSARKRDAHLYQVIGVLPPKLWLFYGGFEVFVPIAEPGETRRAARRYYPVARLRKGVTPHQSQAALSALAGNLVREFPDTNQGWSALARPLEEVVTEDTRLPLLALLAAVGLLLLIACTNVANLLLVRASARRRELAVRAALGAGRWRLTRQLLAEACLLGIAAAALGILLALGGVKLLTALLPGTLAALAFWPGLDRIAVNAPVLAFTTALSVLTCLLFGLVPAWQAGRADANTALHDRSAGGTPRSRHLRQALVLVQVAFSVVLLSGAGLLFRSLLRLEQIDLGFRPQRLLVLRAFPHSGDKRVYYEELVPKLAALPGVEAVTLTNFEPLTGIHTRRAFTIPGRPTPSGEDAPWAGYQVVAPNFFTALGVPLRAGRYLDTGDRQGSEPVLVANQTLARTWWPNRQAVGNQIVLEGEKTPARIVGVVADVRHDLTAAAAPMLYRTNLQDPSAGQQVALRTAGDPLAVSAAIRREVGQLGGIVADIGPMSDLVLHFSWRQRLSGWLFALFAAIAFVLAALGVWAVVAYAVSQRTREIGIRIALGASRGRVMFLVLSQGIAPVVAGLLVGLSGAVALSHMLANLLYGVTPRDPLTFSIAAFALAAAAVAACWLPARRAARIQPAEALRWE